ncbi:MAG: glycosyltransferase [Lachnospiraceae bacterium]|nr:glycosyltransferase [Lachnospiraceae bacterium]
MKIAMMTNSYKPFVAGVPISVERLTKGLRALGHQVVVFAPSYDNQQQEEDVVRYGSLLRGIVGGFSVPNHLDPKIEREFRKGKFDVIHVHHPMMIGSTARYLSWKYQVPLVYTYHTRYEQYLHYVGLSGLKGLMPLYLHTVLRGCDMVIAPTPAISNYLEQIPLHAQVEVLPTGLSDDSFWPDEDRAQRLREELAGSKTHLFCTVARLAKEKNLEFLLESLWHYKQKAGADFKLALVGDGPERSKLMKRAKALEMEEEIVFAGQVPNEEIKNYCRASDLFLFTSCSETQGIVLLEAMAAGTPVLALRATGTDDIVINGENGYMTDVSGERRRDEQLFAQKLMDILEKKELDFLRQGALRTAGGYKGLRIAGCAEKYYSKVLFAYQEKKSRFSGNPLADMLYWTGH